MFSVPPPNIAIFNQPHLSNNDDGSDGIGNVTVVSVVDVSEPGEQRDDEENPERDDETESAAAAIENLSSSSLCDQALCFVATSPSALVCGGSKKWEIINGKKFVRKRWKTKKSIEKP